MGIESVSQNPQERASEIRALVQGYNEEMSGMIEDSRKLSKQMPEMGDTAGDTQKMIDGYEERMSAIQTKIDELMKELDDIESNQ